ncbi:MAG: DUF1631 domain-containing protein [Burkholderiaceae bacterium]|nr:DUF1631 domain-containing protein [Burkholderiaceae bacterium]
MSSPMPPAAARRIATQARQQFVQGLCADLHRADITVLEFLTALMIKTGTARDMQDHRDGWTQYQAKHLLWVEKTCMAWQGALIPYDHTEQVSGAGRAAAQSAGQFELLSDDVVENRILASRMALTISEQVALPFDAARRGTQSLEGHELSSSDILRPESICLLLIEPWISCGLERSLLMTVVDPLQRDLANLLEKQYQRVNEFYAEQGVTSQVDLKQRVRRVPSSPAAGSTASAGLGSASSMAGLASQALTQAFTQMQTHIAQRGPARGSGYGGNAGSSAGTLQALSAMTPLARARQRAQGVMGQLGRLLAQPAGRFERSNWPSASAAQHLTAPISTAPASAALASALAAQRVNVDVHYSSIAMLTEDISPAAVVKLAGAVRERSIELKKKAITTGEKAIIEVVALMFQSILAEDRIPPAVRVWFARLQVPVLRVALAEPEFFSNIDHPARKLIDRMGACVLGFNASTISGTALESEIRRVVQVIEQYPETGHKVFQLVHGEFEKFLAKFLTENQSTSRLVSVAQQVEQRETLTIQYTIELRAMLRDIPVRDEIREFLFKTWTEVLALSAVRDGPQHVDTITLKRTAADLVWAASAKPNRTERSQVIQNLPTLLQRLRHGLTLLGIHGAEQDAQVKTLTDTLADAFLSKTAAIPQAHIDDLAQRLAHLEDFISDDGLGEMPLSADNIEMMLGIDASSIHVVADNDAPVEEAMVAWAQELPLGAWYTLDHNGASAQVQYAWQSDRKQLHLFAASDGSSYLIQLRRLAAYLQAGLLVAQDDEGITLRATRDALAKLDANPERLLG